jgi:hypothetical protein
LEYKPIYISLNPGGGNIWFYYLLVARNVSCNELVERLGAVCLMISDISLQRKPGYLIASDLSLLFSYFVQETEKHDFIQPFFNEGMDFIKN